ncbi:hypothetical protein NQ318_001931 [Aromia moschata]|uniref:Protein DPCD n=1 Tax=Aromia moschata TaxID=1265417 RepID=A0AAV8Z367_9CUCU|nr:hypothetical protein NQ318_001931 [Aromia moschata]
MSDWFTQLKKAKKSCIVDGKLKKVHYSFGDGREMVEEYNTDTNVVTRRAWRVNKELKGEDKWDIELGDPEPVYDKEKKRNDTRERTTDPENKCIIVRTSNKKYYKKLDIPDLDRLNLLPEQENITFSHRFNTLIITYKKPKELINFEKAVLEELKSVQPKNSQEMDCKPS